MVVKELHVSSKGQTITSDEDEEYSLGSSSDFEQNLNRLNNGGNAATKNTTKRSREDEESGLGSLKNEKKTRIKRERTFESGSDSDNITTEFTPLQIVKRDGKLAKTKLETNNNDKNDTANKPTPLKMLEIDMQGRF